MALVESRGRHVFTVESQWLLRRPDGITRPPVVLLLHGFGDTAERFAATLSSLDVPGAAVLFAGGPIPVEVRDRDSGGRRVGQSWYCFDGDQQRFRASLAHAASYLETLLVEVAERHDLGIERLVVAGYSMGAYTGGFFGLRRTPRPLGVALIAGRLKHEFLEDRRASVSGMPVLLAHGRGDDRFPVSAAADGRERLEAAGARVTAVEHEGGHEWNPTVIDALQHWLDLTLGEAGSGPAGA